MTSFKYVFCVEIYVNSTQSQIKVSNIFSVFIVIALITFFIVVLFKVGYLRTYNILVKYYLLGFSIILSISAYLEFPSSSLCNISVEYIFLRIFLSLTYQTTQKNQSLTINFLFLLILGSFSRFFGTYVNGLRCGRYCFKSFDKK